MPTFEINRKLIKERLNSMKAQAKKQGYLWKPNPGKAVIRIVPYKYDGIIEGKKQKNFPFIELFFHYDIGKRSILSPMSFGKPDPIQELAEKLARTGEQDDWRLSRKLTPKMRTYSPMIVRGEEDAGVRFWGYGKEVYSTLLSYLDDADYGNIADPEAGRDLTVQFIPKEESGRNFPTTKILPKPNQTVLAGDDAVIENLLNVQKDITEVFSLPTYDELKETLNTWLEGGQDETEETEETSQPKANAQSVDEITADFDEVMKRADKVVNEG